MEEHQITRPGPSGEADSKVSSERNCKRGNDNCEYYGEYSGGRSEAYHGKVTKDVALPNPTQAIHTKFPNVLRVE